MGVSNKITAALNFVALLCSIAVIGAGIWLASKPDNQCIHQFRWPVAVLGALIFFASLAGFVGAAWNKQRLLLLYLFFMAALIVLLLILLVLAFIVTRPDGSYATGAGFREYRLAGFSSWLRDHAANPANWGKIRNCLVRSDVCNKLAGDYLTADQFFQSHLSPLQSGCCKPPLVCGFTYVNPVTWINPVNQAGNPDCFVWSNDPNLLCYGCDSCKAGLLGNLRQEWRKVNVILIVAVVVFIWVYLIACCAYKNAETEGLFRRYKQGWT